MLGVYLIHFAEGIPCRSGAYRPSVAQHYIGWAESIETRMAQHARGSGGRLMAEVVRREIPWTLARVWTGADRTFESALKKRRKARLYCPCCVGASARLLRACTWDELRLSLDAVHCLTEPLRYSMMPGWNGRFGPRLTV